jgi:hypothetical protein
MKMAKNKYEITYYLSNATGGARQGPNTSTVEAESETNAIMEIKKKYPDSSTRKFDLVSVKTK